jgi:NAD(P)-dependent dehydrogenase (short-subunit alcohol dehydrogenase family)
VVTTTNAFLPLLRRSSAPRVVNVSSGLGSLAGLSNPHWAYGAVSTAAYQSSKSALNALTLLYAKELRGTAFKVNAISPGYRATDLAGEGVNARNGAGDPAEGAVIPVRLALLGADGPTGAFFTDDGNLYPW